MPKRGVLYIYWGEKYKKFLDRSIASVKKYHPELPIHVATLPDNSTLLDKARMLEMTPFEETLFLDIDTIVLGRLDFGFSKAIQFGLACTICECPWAKRYGGLAGETVEYNTGVLFFTHKAKPIFDAWAQHASTIDSSIKHIDDGQLHIIPFNDQAGFAKAVEETNFPLFTLPLNWNFRPRWHNSFFGPIRIWHDYSEIPQEIVEVNSYYERDDAIIQYVARQS